MGTVPALTDETPLDQYVATASQTDFTFTFMIFATSDIKVYVNDVLKTETTDYVVKQADLSPIIPADDLPMDGGKVVFNSGLTASDAVSISREIPINRLTGYSVAGAFRANVLNTELTRMQAIMQQLERDISRSIRLSPSDAEGGNLDMPTGRAGNYLAFDGSGNLVVSAGTIGTTPITVSPFMETLLDDTSSSAALATLGVSPFMETVLADTTSDAVKTTLNINLRKQVKLTYFTTSAIIFSAGTWESTASFEIFRNPASITKSISNTWVEGSGASIGGLDTGTVAINTWYNCFVIYNSTTGDYDAIFTAANSPSLPAGYGEYGRVGSIRTDGSGNIRQFITARNKVIWKTPILDEDFTVGTSRIDLPNQLSSSVPPKVTCNILMNAFIDNATLGTVVSINSSAITDQAPSLSADGLGNILVTDSSGGISPVTIHGVNFGQLGVSLKARSSNASTTLRLSVLGYEDLSTLDVTI